MEWRSARNVARSSGQHYFPGGQHYMPTHTPGQQWLFNHVTWRSLDQSRSRISDSDITIQLSDMAENRVTEMSRRWDDECKLCWAAQLLLMLSDAFHSSLGLQLVGPYDVLSGKTKRHTGSERPNYLCHWRYYYDPPEFLTVVRGDDKKQFHLGYYRYVVTRL